MFYESIILSILCILRNTDHSIQTEKAHKVLLKLKELDITKISIGIQSFQDKFLKILGRGKTDYGRMFEALKQVGKLRAELLLFPHHLLLLRFQNTIQNAII